MFDSISWISDAIRAFINTWREHCKRSLPCRPLHFLQSNLSWRILKINQQLQWLWKETRVREGDKREVKGQSSLSVPVWMWRGLVGSWSLAQLPTSLMKLKNPFLHGQKIQVILCLNCYYIWTNYGATALISWWGEREFGCLQVLVCAALVGVTKTIYISKEKLIWIQRTPHLRPIFSKVLWQRCLYWWPSAITETNCNQDKPSPGLVPVITFGHYEWLQFPSDQENTKQKNKKTDLSLFRLLKTFQLSLLMWFRILDLL